jgi:hypothetical protein
MFTTSTMKLSSCLFLLLLHLLHLPHIKAAAFGNVHYDDWSIHVISNREAPHDVDQPTYYRVTLYPIIGDADLFVSPCGLPPKVVVNEYLGYSFTHGKDDIWLPSYVIQDIQEELCAYVLGKAVNTLASYKIEASVVIDDINGKVYSSKDGHEYPFLLSVSTGSHVTGMNNEGFSNGGGSNDFDAKEPIRFENKWRFSNFFREAWNVFLVIVQFILSV